MAVNSTLHCTLAVVGQLVPKLSDTDYYTADNLEGDGQYHSPLLQ
jgi:hypothetical protein